jgi:hypothetical protein
MIHFAQMARAADDQALGLIPRVPLGIGIGIILRGKRGIGGVFHGAYLPIQVNAETLITLHAPAIF